MANSRNGIYIGLSVVLLTIVIFFVFFPFGTKEEGQREIQLDQVEFGKVVRSFPGEGVVEPQSEVLILSPGSSIIKEILKEEGSSVRRGDPIIILDPTPIQVQIEKIQDQLEMKQNALLKNHLNARATKVDLEYNVQVKNLRIASLKSELADQEQLLSVGGISPAKFEKTRQELELAEKDLKMMKEKNSIKLQQLQADEDGLRLQIEMQEKELHVKEEALGKMIVRAPSAGIILVLNGKVGEKVSTDRLLIEMSDLSNFKIRGRCDDDYSGHFKTGNKVYVHIDGEELPGVVGTINPVIRERKVEFDVNLAESDHFRLRPNLTVDLQLVRRERDSVLRVHHGPVFGKGRIHHVYIMQNGTAQVREVETGLKTEEYIEVVSGLKEGDMVILTDVPLLEDIEAAME